MKTLEQKIVELENNQEFIDFYCYSEDKWLQNANFKTKLETVFGSIDNAIKAFNQDDFFNSKNH